MTFLSLASDSTDVLQTPTFHARAAGREGRDKALVAGRVGPRLRCESHDLGLGIAQVTLTGRLDIATARQADRALRSTQAVALLVVLDLRRVKFVGCTAARVAVMADARARRTGGRLVVLAAATPGPRLFALGQLHRRLEIVDRFPGAHHAGDQP